MAYIELKKSAFYNNLDVISSKCGAKSKIAIVLKDNAAGVDSQLINDLRGEEAETLVRYSWNVPK